MVSVDSEPVVAAYGEPVEFYMWDRQDLPLYLRLMTLNDDQSMLWEVVKELVLDETGNPILRDGEILPVEIMVPVVEAAINHLGNTMPQTTQP